MVCSLQADGQVARQEVMLSCPPASDCLEVVYIDDIIEIDSDEKKLYFIITGLRARTARPYRMLWKVRTGRLYFERNPSSDWLFVESRSMYFLLLCR